MRRLGVDAEHEADLDAALKEFEVHPDDDNRLMHPRVLREAQRLAAERAKKSKGGLARKAQLLNNKSKPQGKRPLNTA